MKKLLIISVLVLLSNIIVAQKNNWIDSIINRVILNEILIFDTEFKPIKNDKIKLTTIDTVINCQWTRPKFVDNIYQSSFDGVLIENRIDFDTLSNKIDTNYIDFIIQSFDKNGNYLKDTVIFLVNRAKSGFGNSSPEEVDLANKLKQTKWKNSKIDIDGLEMELDSCHIIFSFQLDEDFTFYQSFGSNQNNCSTQEMKNKKEVGVEGNSAEFFQFYNKLQGHYLSIQKGVWKVNNNELKLMNVDRKKVITFVIEKLNKEELHLKLKESNYKIKMKKVNR